jgi:branched-chain amino acid transport system substrate-binding protein
MDNVPWPNFRDAQTQRLAAEFLKRSSGKAFDTSGYTYEAVRVIADVLERARSTDPDTLVDAIKKTNYSRHLMVANGPIRFDEGGDNPNVGTAMIQILDQKPRLVWPKAVADEKFVFPRPKR